MLPGFYSVWPASKKQKHRVIFPFPIKSGVGSLRGVFINSYYSVSEKSKILTFSTNAGGSCVKKPWNPAGFVRTFALLPPLICEKFVIFFVFRYTLEKLGKKWVYIFAARLHTKHKSKFCKNGFMGEKQYESNRNRAADR